MRFTFADSILLKTKSINWCGRGDLNPHAFRRHPLKMVCLPISPLPHSRMQPALRLSKQKRRGILSIAKQSGWNSMGDGRRGYFRELLGLSAAVSHAKLS